MKLKKILIYIAIIVLAVSIVPKPAYAVPSVRSGLEKAVDLKILGLITDSPDNFQLNRAPTRLEGVIILVRLLGKDKQASQGHYKHPFTDVPSWAGSFVGYAYQNKLVKGAGNSRFGSNEPLTAKQYSAFLLLSLGYKDGLDFNDDNALETAAEKGLLTKAEATSLNGRKTFLRDDMIGLTYNALTIKLKGSAQSLLDKLVSTDKAVFKPAARMLGLYTSDLQPELGMTPDDLTPSNGKAAKTNAELFRLIRDALYDYETKVAIDVSSYGGDAAKDFDKTFDKALKAAEAISGVQHFVSQWKYETDGTSLDLTFEYRYSKSEYETRKSNYISAVDKARHIVAKQLTANMSDYMKEKTLHDYVINNTVFDYKSYLSKNVQSTSYDAYGCLVRGIAVCEGYTRAMQLLCDLSGIECMIVTGKSKNNGVYEEHAWNIVKIDGAYCHVDLTSDDPVSNDGTNLITYCYFNLTDKEIARSNVWDRKAYPVCSTNRNSYYYRSSKLANNKKEFDKAVLEALGKRSSIIEIKVMDYSKPRYASLTDLMIKSGNVLKYRYTVNDDFGIIRIFNIQYT